ncbi:MAG: hypothetical protein IK015_09110 [Treponema sp.]|nr:hypothetical protein [Treponema sp.]
MTKTFWTAALALLSLSLFAQTKGVEFSGEVETLCGAAAPWTDQDSSAGRWTMGDIGLTGKLDAYYENCSACADGTVKYDAVASSLDFSLNELWADWTNSVFGIRAGRQKAAWGKADGVDITNTVFAKDMSNLSAIIKDDNKLAIDGLRLSASGNSFAIDAYWIPFMTATKLATKIQTTKPSAAIWNGEWGLKAAGYFSALDVSLYAFYGWDKTPLVDYSMAGGAAGAIVAKGQYERLAMIGADAAVPIGQTVLRIEAAFFPQRRMQKSAQRILAQKAAAGASECWSAKKQLCGLLGLDWMPGDWTLTAQYYCDAALGSLDGLDRSYAFIHGATLSVSKKILSETLTVSFKALVEFNDLSFVLYPSASYSVTDQLKFKGGACIFVPGPDKKGSYGAYKDLSSFFVGANFCF